MLLHITKSIKTIHYFKVEFYYFNNVTNIIKLRTKNVYK